MMTGWFRRARQTRSTVTNREEAHRQQRLAACAAYRMLGLRLEKGEFSLAPDAFSPKGGLQLRRVTCGCRTFAAEKGRKASV